MVYAFIPHGEERALLRSLFLFIVRFGGKERVTKISLVSWCWGMGLTVSGVYRVAKGGTVINGGISRSGEEAGHGFSIGLFAGGFC